jgi:hypothetical protein
MGINKSKKHSKRKSKICVEDTMLPSPLPSSSDSPNVTPTRSPITKELIRLGYDRDPWFQKHDNTCHLSYKNNIWWKGKAIVLPRYIHFTTSSNAGVPRTTWTAVHLGFHPDPDRSKTYFLSGME